MSIEKKSRARAKDPAQEKVRSQKDVWNKACSEFISRLIAFKRGLNGRGDARYSIPPSKITEAVPVEVGSLLNELASNFSRLVDSADSITNFQNEYINLRLERLKTNNPNNIKASSEYMLISESSNKLTRFLSHLKGRFSFGPLKTERLSMLSIAANIKQDCLDFQNQIVSKGRKSVVEASTFLHKIQIQLKSLNEYSNSIIKHLDKSPQKDENEEDKTDQELVELNSDASRVKFIINDLVFSLKLPEIEGLYNRFEAKKILASIKSFERENDLSKKEFYFSELDILYKKYLRNYSERFLDLATKKGFNLKNYDLSSFRSIYENYEKLLESKEELAFQDEEKIASESDVVKLAHSRVSRWLKNKLLKLNPSNATSSIRSNIFESSESFKETLNVLMDMLEKNIDADLLKSSLEKLNDKFSKIEELFSTLDGLSSIEELKDPALVDKLQDLMKKRKLRQLSLGI